MNSYGKLCGIENVRKQLVDDYSRDIFDLRIDYFYNRNEDEFCNNLYDVIEEKNFRIPWLDKRIRGGNFNKIVIFGAGQYGFQTLQLLKHSKYRDYDITFCDNNQLLWGNKACGGVNCIPPTDLFEHYNGELVIIAGRRWAEIYGQCYISGLPIESVLLPAGGILYGACGRQYFDMFPSERDEIFIDAGCFDGKTSIDFADWTHNQYKKIVAFEANPFSWSRCEATLAKLEDAELRKVALWKEKTDMHFDVHMGNGGSRIGNGNTLVRCNTIDDELGDSKVTFIKMDIEGAEYDALLGAEKTIKTHHPRMAISIYHKAEDIIEIPQLILDFCPDYKLSLRHYLSRVNETVLYAF